MNAAHHIRIGIDCRLLGNKHAGIGRYIENLLRQLPAQSTKRPIKWVFFFFDESQWQEFLSQTSDPQFFLQQEIVFAPIRHYTFSEQIQMLRIFNAAQLDLLHVPHFNIPIFYSKRLVVTIHDLLWHEFRGMHVTTLSPWKYWIKHTLYTYVVSKAVSKAAAILTPSQTTAEKIVALFPRAKTKITVTYEGVGEIFATHQKKHVYPTTQKQLIYVGSLYPHKNIDVVLQALQLLPEYSLLIVGSRNIFQDSVRQRVQHMNLTRRVEFLGYLSDEQLVQTFASCFGLVQPSLFEGFGLTGIEALACGLPVFASDIPIFKEIYGEKAVFFDPHQPQSLKNAVKRLENPKTYVSFTQFHADTVARFSWFDMTRATCKVYEHALE